MIGQKSATAMGADHRCGGVVLRLGVRVGTGGDSRV